MKGSSYRCYFLLFIQEIQTEPPLGLSHASQVWNCQDAWRNNAKTVTGGHRNSRFLTEAETMAGRAGSRPQRLHPDELQLLLCMGPGREAERKRQAGLCPGRCRRHLPGHPLPSLGWKNKWRQADYPNSGSLCLAVGPGRPSPKITRKRRTCHSKAL